ncbi:sugar transferase [Armatimonas rosea]|uniref:Lipopolysaccharide/colanic/teichoic acid biosynthesis glycosyltransferase n=1 Tax=Armatimonas rosea TaxID=685828 RepID=A0A7W9SU42_ARMRO|nr:lipopolysaccharide/colanic/teichoic acid biosynthesis glycosyltransferase [Armatimonas rosea]
MSVELISTKTQSSRYGAYEALKRGMDISFSFVALLLLFPLFVTISAIIFATDRGPIIYRQKRVGRGGRLFTFYKFRSMVTNADELKAKLAHQNEASGPIFKMKNDPRITPIGRILRKTSLDELPQLWSVLRGDMSLVGPRPHLQAEIDAYEGYPLERLSVIPGLICYREICGRSSLTFERWLELDLEYIQTRSLKTDLTILLKSVPAVLLGKGAY